MKRIIVLIAAVLLVASCTKITTEPQMDKDVAIEMSNKQTPGWIPNTGTMTDVLPDTSHAKPECVPPPPGHGLNGNQGRDITKPNKPVINPRVLTEKPVLVAPHIWGFSDISGWSDPPVQPPIPDIPNSLNDGVNKEIKPRI
jgi:hypothetical protein